MAIAAPPNSSTQAKCPSQSRGKMPYVAAGNSSATFLSKACSGWLFEQTETGGAPQFILFTGCPVSGVLLVEDEKKFRSVQYLTDLGSENYSLGEILTVGIEKDGDQFIVIEPQRGWYGYGSSEVEAVGRFASSLVEEFEGLSKREQYLSEPMLRELAQLRKVVVPNR